MYKFQYCMEVRVEEGKVEPGYGRNRRLGTASGTGLVVSVGQHQPTCHCWMIDREWGTEARDFKYGPAS
jgi:hypothetical protein